jgi:long-chain fatty acid transport protein
MTDYSAPWTGSAQSNKFSITTYNINPAIAYKVNDAVSLGFGINYQHFDADYQRQLSTMAALPFPSLAAVLAGHGFLMPGDTPLEAKLSGDAWGWNAGALFKLSPSTKLGLSYRSQLNYNLTGTLTASGSSAQTNSVLSGDIKANLTLPDTAIASITHQLNDKWELLGDVQWTGWGKLSSIDIGYTSGTLAGQTAQTLNTNFRNTWRIAVGANYKINDSWKLKTGLAWDQSPVRGDDTRLASLPDNDRYWVSAGVQYKPTKLATVDLGVAYMFMHKASINNNQSAAGLGTLTGAYDDSGVIVGLQYSQAF